MAIRRITIGVPDEVASRIKRAAGDKPVSTWVTELIEEHLDDAELERLWQEFCEGVTAPAHQVRWRYQRLRAPRPVAPSRSSTDSVDLTSAVAKLLGRMLGATGQSDPVGAHVVLLARERAWPAFTSGSGNLLAIGPTLRLERI